MSIFEFFVEETIELFTSISMAMQSNNPTEPLLLRVFNDEQKSAAILFHFRVGVILELCQADARSCSRVPR